MTDILTLIGVSSASSLGILAPACEVVQQMANAYPRIKLGQKKCKLVIRQAALIVKELHATRNDRLPRPNIAKLQMKFEEIRVVLQKLADMPFFKALLHFEDINKEIERANRHLVDCWQLFPTIIFSSSLQAQRNAAMSDREALRALLQLLAGNYEEIRRRFDIYSEGQEDQAMAAMERELRNVRTTCEEDMPVEVQIMQKSLECIKTTTGRSVPKQRKWLITEYDLDYCGTIGRGGFSTVSKARFRGTMVAVKTLKDIGNMREALEREIEIWSMLRHDHIVPFYGASTLTSPPFIVSRYMQNGNLVRYIAAMPNADRTKLIFEISLGMYYLHEEYVVHGDLKAVNVLVDDSGKACITDFGLSKICSSSTIGSETSKIAGTLRFLAPEALKGEPLSFETDVYAFGMVIYEVFTEEIPLIREPDHLVMEGRAELHRPTSTKVYERGFNDVLWQLLSDCISHKPSTRPRFKTIQEHLFSIKKAEPSAQPAYPGNEGHLTDWGLDTTAWSDNDLLEKSASVSAETPERSVSRVSLPPRLADPSAQSINPETQDTNVTNWLEDKPMACPPGPPTSIKNVSSLFRRSKVVSVDQPRVPIERTVSYDIRTLPPILPMCIVVTHKYFDVPFGVPSREPAVYLEKANTTQWQPLAAKKGSLLYEEGTKFCYRSDAGDGTNSWELGGNSVTLRTSSSNGVCRFRDAQMAKKWFRLQINYARSGSADDWETTMGDWFYTERSWRRLVRGKIQHADLVKGSNEVPSDRSWSDTNFPKRCIMDNSDSTGNCIGCITDPGKQPGRLRCRLEGQTIILETYRRQNDEGPVYAREEAYPSEEYAGMTFRALKALLEKAVEKNKRLIVRSR